MAEGYADDLTLLLKSLGYEQDLKQLNEILNILDHFRRISGLTINKSKTQICAFGHVDNPTIFKLADNTRIEFVKKFKLLGIEFDSKLEHMQDNYVKQLEKMRKEIFIWIRARLSNEEKAQVVKVHGLSKFNHIAAILPDPHNKIIEQIESIISRFIQAGSYKTTKENIFLPKHLGGLGVPRLKEHWAGLRLSWMKRTFTSNSFWLKLLTENLPHERLLLFPRETYAQAFTDGHNDFWHCTLRAWKKLMKNVENGIQDRFKDLPERNYVIMSQVNQNFHEHWTGIPDWLKFHMTPEAFITSNFNNNRYTYSFKNLRDVQTMCGKRINFILHEKIKRLLKPLLQQCKEAQIPLSSTMPLNLPIEHTILRINKKGCSHLRKMYRKVAEFDINNWKHMQNCTEMSTLFDVQYAPFEAEKIIRQVYTSNTVPHARDLQISIFRNNVLTRKNLYNKKLVPSPYCRFCPTQEETLHHRLVSCRKSKPIWDTVNHILIASHLIPVFDKEVYHTDYESGVHAVKNQIIMYTRWYIDQAKMQEDQPSVFSFPSALLNLLDSQYHQLSPGLINKPQYEKVLHNIYELYIKR